ncbi:phragmoplastin interacting protein 1-like [Magnolia sinica]|uniref:phragmoplastin interacting protein 1-like n=1 Tax=Magnolia sinica TaxID=86752 RepID=UPI00265A418D|nr:phragmoplastin interacting protein 1-like [Magnolia sinica]
MTSEDEKRKKNKKKKPRKDKWGQPLPCAAAEERYNDDNNDNESKTPAAETEEEEERQQKRFANTTSYETQTLSPSHSKEDVTITSEDEKRKKKKKKPRKDKWGQLLPSAAAEERHNDNESNYYNESTLPAAEREEEEERQPKQYANATSYETHKVVLSGMPYTTTEEDIRELFKDMGSISQLQLSRFPDSGNFRGLAFLTFATEEMATNALELDGTKMGNRFVKIEQCRLDPERKRKSEFLDEPKKADGCLSAYIGNLSWDVTEDDIRDCFKESKITSIRFAVDKKTGTFRGFGHIDFEDDESLEEAMKKNQVELNGRPMKIAYAVK